MRVRRPRTLLLAFAAAFAGLALLGAWGGHWWPHAFHGPHGVLLPALFYTAFTVAAFRVPSRLDADACPGCGREALPTVESAGFCARCGATR